MMEKSRNEWSGYIEDPQILQFTPERFADGVLEVIDSIFQTIGSFKQDPDLIWLTNIPTPYRIPTWKVLNSRINFHLIFLSKTERDRHWNLSDSLNGLIYQYTNQRALYFGKLIPLYFNFRKTIKILRKLNGKSIYIDGWESPAFFVSAFYAKQKGMKLIYGYRSTLDSHRFNNILIRKVRSVIFSKADFIVTAGTASTSAVKAMGIAPEKIITLFNPVDVSWFYSFAQSHRIEQTPGHRYIYVSRLIELKNIATVIKAFASIRRGSDTLTIAGDGPLAQELKNLTSTLGLSDSIIFDGHKNQEELAQLYAASNTLILASTNEVWGLVVNEALASGLHVVVSDKCGIAEFVKDMKGAYISSTDQQTIEHMMEKSRNEWSGYIEDPQILQFTPERFADGVLRILQL
jgi:glycosyltransferase involved in cell wall biosynthesis